MELELGIDEPPGNNQNPNPITKSIIKTHIHLLIPLLFIILIRNHG